MSYFTTGLEGLMEKVALTAARVGGAPRPAPVHPQANHPQYAARMARRQGPQAPAGGTVPLPGKVPSAAPKAQPGYENTPQMQAAADKLKQRGAQRRSASPADRMQASSDANDAFMKKYDIKPAAPSSAAPAPAAPAATATGVAAPKAPGGLRRGLKRFGIGAGVGLGAMALGTGWALKKEHDRDKEQRGLAYAPMTSM